MKFLAFIRPWLAVIFAFFVLAMSWGKADATSSLAAALPMCMFFACAVAHHTQRQLMQTQAQLKRLQDAMQLKDSPNS